MPLPPFTSVVALDGASNGTQIPSCAKVVDNHASRLRDVYQAMNDARRVVVLCGAGISVHAGIPDFRSSNGLFESLKREHPKENITSGRDLFDAAVFKSEETMTVFYKMISRLATLSDAAQPTPFHDMLQGLDARGQLLRVYTQNIDALEERAGLSFGVPIFPSRSRKRKVDVSPSPARPQSSSSERPSAPSPVSHVCTPPGTASSSTQTSPTSTPAPTPQLPRCVPLHGTLKHLYCPSCYFTLPLCAPKQLESLRSGNSLACPQCAELDGTRRLVGKRTRGVARLRPGVVLYNEPHREGEAERVGECVRRDLMGLGSDQLSRTNSARKKRIGDDMLIVAGTSLRIPGAKRIVREFAKALHPTPLTNPGNDPRIQPTKVKTVYLNFDFPVPAREWDGVFDVWVQGDVQTFARGFENYQVEAERGSTNVRGPTTTSQSKRDNLVTIREPRTPTRGVTYPTKSLEEPTSRSRVTSAGRGSKHTVSPNIPLSPRIRARAPHPTRADYEPLQRTQIKHAPESPSTRLKIKIKRPMRLYTPDESKPQFLPLPQETCGPLMPVDVDVDQGLG